MSRELVLVHGRAQEHKDAAALKAEWLGALREGLARGGLELPVAEAAVRFAYYGDTLYDLVGGRTADEAAAVVVRGADDDPEERAFVRAVLEEVRQHAGITPAQLAQAGALDAVERGPGQHPWVRAVLRAIDLHVPHGSGAAVALVTHDVYRYLRDSGVREAIERGVAAAITPGVETVVVAHSLGSVVAYNLLRREGHLRGWKVPLFVTVGSPLGITAIRRTLRSFAPLRCPECVGAWFNALDPRDVVALHPLDPARFPLAPAEPAIENRAGVRNRTSNRHGIAGYLDDAEVARRIHAALVA